MCKLRMIPNISGCGSQETGITTEKRYKRSRQRLRMLELLQSTGRHPTADWIYERLKDEFPHLSMGTVYRNLHILMEQEMISKIDFGSTFDRFDANTAPHYHFICDRCGSIIDLNLDIDPSLNTRVNRTTPYQARRHRIEFYGVCDRCHAESVGRHDGRR